MALSFEDEIDRTNTLSAKWDGAPKVFGRDDVLPLWVADMDFAAPPAVLEALRRRIDHGVMGYSSAPDSFYESVMLWLEKRHGWRIARDWLVFSPKVMFSVNTAISALTEPGDRIAVQVPLYPPLFASIERNGRQVVYNPLRAEGGRYRMDLEDLASKLGQGVRLMILCSPHNPVGRVWESGELLELGRLCLENRVPILSDEIHCDLVFSGHAHRPVASLEPELAAGSITLVSPSKTFNVPGIWSSFAVIPDRALRERFQRRLEEQGMAKPSLIGILSTEAAYLHGAAWLEDVLAYLEGNRNLLETFVAAEMPEMRLYAPEGTYLAWMDFRFLGMDDGELKAFLVQQAGVGLNPGSLFGPGGSGFQRLNLGCSRAVLRRALERIRDAVRSRGR